MAKITDLPEELISNISVKLGSDDIFAFRLTNKALEQKSLHEFATEYFTNKGFIFTTESLKVLVSIANSEKLRRRLQTVIFVPVLFSDRAFNCCNGPACQWKPTTRHSEAFRGYIQDQQALKESGKDFEMIAYAFSKMTALDRLAFVDTIEKPALDVRGLSMSRRKTNNIATAKPHYPEDKEYYQLKNHVWKTMMRAVADSGLALTKLGTDLDVVKNPLSVAVNLNFNRKVLLGLRKSFRGLKRFAVQISSNHSVRDIKKDGLTLKSFASTMQSLEELSLSFSSTASSNTLCNSFLTNVKLHKLTRFNLDSVYMSAKSLGVTVCKLSQINDLQLTYVNLTAGTWIPILQAIQKLKKLNHLHLRYLTERNRRACFLKPFTEEELGLNDPYDFHINSGADDEGLTDSEDDDDKMPDLVDAGVPLPDSPQAPALQLQPSHDSTVMDAPVLVESTDSPTRNNAAHVYDTSPSTTENSHGTPDHIAPNDLTAYPTERGYYICLHGDQIAQQIPTFIKEYNLSEEHDDALGFPGGPPGAFNNFMTMLGGVLGNPTNVTGNAQAGAATFQIPPMPPPPPGLFGPFPMSTLGVSTQGAATNTNAATQAPATTAGPATTTGPNANGDTGGNGSIAGLFAHLLPPGPGFGLTNPGLGENPSPAPAATSVGTSSMTTAHPISAVSTNGHNVAGATVEADDGWTDDEEAEDFEDEAVSEGDEDAEAEDGDDDEVD